MAKTWGYGVNEIDISLATRKQNKNNNTLLK